MSFSLAFSFLNKQTEGWQPLHLVVWQQMRFCWNVQLWIFFQRLVEMCHCTRLIIRRLIFLRFCNLTKEAGPGLELSVQKVSQSLVQSSLLILTLLSNFNVFPFIFSIKPNENTPARPNNWSFTSNHLRKLCCWDPKILYCAHVPPASWQLTLK